MSLFGSLFTGVAGLNAQSRAMSMISDNVANVNTTAYKGSTPEFADMVTGQNSVRSYSPGGVQALTGQSVSVQGLIQNTSSPTDAAISGAGFFVVNSRPDGTGEQLYSRAGSFTPDYLGNLKTNSGYYLQGWALDANGKVADVNNVANINIRGVSGVATATTTVRIGANLNADQPPFTGAYAGGDLALHNASGGTQGTAPDFTRSVQVYDSLGRPHDLTVAFLRNGAAGTWQAEVYAAPGDVDTTKHPNGLIASGPVTFNGDGSLASAALTPVQPSPVAGSFPIDWNPAAGASPSSISFNLGTAGQTDGLSQLSSPNDVAFVSQNGAEVGELNGVSIDDQGYVVGSFTNGQQRKLYLLPVATFAAPGALTARSGNVFAQTDGSGAFNLKAAGTGGAGVITPSALEGANVDLADEFTRMIVTQRAYSANARVISTTDQMLDELLHVSR